MSKDKKKWSQKFNQKYLEEHQAYSNRLKTAIINNVDPLYRYDQIDGSNGNLIRTELQENFYHFTKWLLREYPGKIVSVGLEDGIYVVHWKAPTKEAVVGSSTFDGIPVKYIREK